MNGIEDYAEIFAEAIADFKRDRWVPRVRSAHEARAFLDSPSQLCQVNFCNNTSPASACGECIIGAAKFIFVYSDGTQSDDYDNKIGLRYPQCAPFRSNDPKKCVVKVWGIELVGFGGHLKAYSQWLTPNPGVGCLNDISPLPLDLDCTPGQPVPTPTPSISRASSSFSIQTIQTKTVPDHW